jgi:uncharacterized Zn finger protein (UPF0148 family)
VPVDVSEAGPWLGFSEHQIRDAFVAYMRTSAFPEHFEGVVQGDAPPEDEDFSIIFEEISVDWMRRGQSLVPCNICGYPKFKHDGMLICVNGWLYIIGPICGEKHYKGRFREKVAQRRRERIEHSAFAFLMGNAGNLGLLNAAAEALSTHVDAAEEALSRLRKSKKVFAELRRAATVQGGWLQVDEKHYTVDEHGEQTPEWRRVNFNQLQGQNALQNKFQLREALDSVLHVLREFGDDEDSALSRLDKAMAADELPELASQVRRAQHRLDTTVAMIRGCQAFFSNDNFKVLAAWAAHRGCPIQMEVTCYDSRRALTAEKARRRHLIDVTKLMRPLPKEVRSIRLDEVA